MEFFLQIPQLAPSPVPVWHSHAKPSSKVLGSPNQATGSRVNMTGCERLEFNVRLLLLFGPLHEISVDSVVNKDRS